MIHVALRRPRSRRVLRFSDRWATSHGYNETHTDPHRSTHNGARNGIKMSVLRFIPIMTVGNGVVLINLDHVVSVEADRIEMADKSRYMIAPESYDEFVERMETIGDINGPVA